MSKLIKNIESITRLEDKGKPYLTILHPSQKPPHIAFTINNICYSLSVKGKKAISIDALIRKFLVTKKQILFLMLDIDQKHHSFKEVLENYKEVDFSKTCLSPIKSYLELALADSYNHLPFVFDVVAKLQEKKLLLKSYGVNIDGDFNLLEYTKKEVDNCIVANLKN